MSLWHCHTIAEDPFYDNADFSDPEFKKKLSISRHNRHGVILFPHRATGVV